MKKILVLLAFLLSTYLIYYFVQKNIIQKNYNRISARSNIILKVLLEKIQSVDSIDYLILGDSSSLHSIVPTLLSKKSWSFSIPGGRIKDMETAISLIDLKKVKKGIIVQNSFSIKHSEEDFFKYIVTSDLYSATELLEQIHDVYYLNKRKENIISLSLDWIKIIQYKLYLTFENIVEFRDGIKSYFNGETGNYGILRYKILASQGFAEITSPSSPIEIKDTFEMDISEIDLKSLLVIQEKTKGKKVYFIIPTWVKNNRGINKILSNLKERGINNFEFVSGMEKGLEVKDYWDNSHLKASGAGKLTINLKKFIEKN